MARNDDEDYWNSSEKKSFSFTEDDEAGGMFGVSLQGTAKLSQQLRDWEPGNSDDLGGGGKPVADPVLPLHQLISEENLKLILESTITKAAVVSDLSPKEIVEKIVSGLPVNLEHCKSLSTKSELLSCAVASGDGEAILTVTIFVIKTLSRKHSYNLLREHSSAFTHYVNYLSSRGDHAELCDILEAMGHYRAAAIVHYKSACQNRSNAKKLMKNMSTVAKSHFHNNKDEKIIQQHMKLLEFQIENNLQPELTAQQTIMQAASKHSTDALRNLAVALGMSERIFQWTCLQAKINLKAWGEIQAIFQTKSWLGSQKFKPLIRMETVALELHKAKAPKTEVKRYVRMVDDVISRQKLEAMLEDMSIE